MWTVGRAIWTVRDEKWTVGGEKWTVGGAKWKSNKTGPYSPLNGLWDNILVFI